MVLISRLLLILEDIRISWAENLLLMSDLTFGPSFKVKRWFTGFGELSFQWVQICIGSPMRRSSLCLLPYYLPPGSPAGDCNLHHVCACVRVCVRVCVCHAVSSETTTVTHFW